MAIAMDMNASYHLVVQEKLPAATIVYDRYHMQAQFGKEVLGVVRLEEARRHNTQAKVLKETLAELPPQEQKAVKEQIHAQQTEYRQLKKLRWSLLTNGATLHPDKAKHLHAILENHSDLAVCYAMKEELCRLFSLRDVSQAVSSWNAWFDAAKESGIPALAHFASLKEKRLPGLVAHAIFPISTGKLEGFNNKVKVAKRIGYGYRNDAYFFTLVRFLTWMA